MNISKSQKYLPMSSISDEKVSWIGGEVCLNESLMVSEDSSSYSGPGSFYTQRSTYVIPFDLLTLRRQFFFQILTAFY